MLEDNKERYYNYDALSIHTDIQIRHEHTCTHMLVHTGKQISFSKGYFYLMHDRQYFFQSYAD